MDSRDDQEPGNRRLWNEGLFKTYGRAVRVASNQLSFVAAESHRGCETPPGIIQSHHRTRVVQDLRHRRLEWSR